MAELCEERFGKIVSGEIWQDCVSKHLAEELRIRENDTGMSVETVMAQHRQIESQVQSQTQPETQVYHRIRSMRYMYRVIQREVRRRQYKTRHSLTGVVGQEVMKSADSYQCQSSLIDGVGEYLMFLG